MEKGAASYVIARCFGDEPKRVLCAREQDGYLVALSANAEWVGFPADYLFKDDSALYHQLKDAFDNGKKRELFTLWERAEPIPLSKAVV